MTKQWLDMGLRPRAVTRDLSWGIPLPLEDKEWQDKCVYVWFEAVQGYTTCAQIWSESIATKAGHPDGKESWKKWWMVDTNGDTPRHLYFLGKDNIPFHTVIWPALIMGLNHANAGKNSTQPVELPTVGELALETNVPAMEYLMLAGGQFSKSRKHAVWLPSFLERFDPDTLRYYLSINMPENHDTDFNWPDFVEKINSELIAAYGNFVHRILTLGARLPKTVNGPFVSLEMNNITDMHSEKLEKLHLAITTSLERHRYKEALRYVMNAAQYGNQIIQAATPWKYLGDKFDGSDVAKESLASLAFGWRICRYLAVVTQPFLPFSAQKLWDSLGQPGQVAQTDWYSAIDWQVDMTWNDKNPEPLFKRLELDEILKQEQSLVSKVATDSNFISNVKGGKKGGKKMNKQIEGIQYLDFNDFMKVELKVGKITSVEEHPNADKLYVVNLDDGDKGRVICAGIKQYYTAEQLTGMQVIFVSNLQPRPLRGVTSEGMMLAADDGNGLVKLITVDGEISTGSTVR